MRRSLLAVLLLAAVVAPVTRGDAAPDWNALRRPLHLLPVARGAPCPLSRRATEITAAKYGTDGAIGRGPVYPILPARSILLVVRPREWGRRWAGEKVFWLVRPDYTGPVLIRGRRLDGPQWLRFDEGKRPSAELRIRPGETVKWTRQAPGSRGRPSYLRARAAGCYGVQIDGTSFSTVVVFLVDIAR